MGCSRTTLPGGSQNYIAITRSIIYHPLVVMLDYAIHPEDLSIRVAFVIITGLYCVIVKLINLFGQISFRK